MGARLGKLQSKLAIISLLRKFTFDSDAKQKNTNITQHPKAAVLLPLNSLKFKAFRR